MTQDTQIILPDHDWPDFPPGLVWLVGAGPGEPGLLTLQALHALRLADVVVHDALVDDRILAWRRPGSALEYAGKRGGKPSAQQRDISLRLIDLSRAGKRVLRLKGGDPFVFGRGGEEAQTLVQAGIPIRVTPGISAGIGGLAHAGIPVTHRDVNQAVTFLTGHDQTGLAPSAVDWKAVAKGSPVIVIYMAIKHLAQISGELLASGRDAGEPVAIVSNATLPQMRVLETTLGDAAADATAHGMEAPAIVCVGRVVLLRKVIDWAGQLRGEPVRDPDPLGTGGSRQVS
ncbi:uroporphyrinogen-III C-methyltransferase [Tropicimonas sp. IMCC6043]|uniref:uroporphyrinogen-III C-methyltransferase n=1 Tax=Tropicimonas sp. IMCC6043 TaxID=2510645 RepID=UPI00101E02B0|nr:uroporphyrinogen-III C-methyltransferase [Tropicimonas sp. IMCC6043]RYH11648.1 uroporphyrinogen-III C-methyltransferase [Tropicimonas sp. IMCC6043]